MIKLDLHTHTTFSADGISPLGEMVAEAQAQGMRYYGVSDHFDYDYMTEHAKINGKEIDYIDEAAYFAAGRALQTGLKSDRLKLLIGGEFGYSSLGECKQMYLDVIGRYRPDFVVNSVHRCDGYDCWFGEYFQERSKELAYGRYLETVRESLDAPYGYDIVAHIGYVSRNAPYPDPKISYSDFSDLYDEILSAIVAKGKILEVNTSPRHAGSDFLPDTDVLSRYYELGGRKISYGSDAHGVSRVGEKYECVLSALRSIGFTGFTVPCGGEHTFVPFSEDGENRDVL